MPKLIFKMADVRIHIYKNKEIKNIIAPQETAKQIIQIRNFRVFTNKKNPCEFTLARVK